MNREIKFRAWDVDTNRIWTWKEIRSAFDVWTFSSDSFLMQFTGLKDKNGVEVYEGDIVKCTKGCPHEIIWKDEYAGTYFGGMPAWYLSGLNDGYAWTGDEEIIGNIYENPDLLQ